MDNNKQEEQHQLVQTESITPIVDDISQAQIAEQEEDEATTEEIREIVHNLVNKLPLVEQQQQQQQHETSLQLSITAATTTTTNEPAVAKIEPITHNETDKSETKGGLTDIMLLNHELNTMDSNSILIQHLFSNTELDSKKL